MAESFSVKAILSAKDANFSSTFKKAINSANQLKETITSGFGFGIMMGAGQKAFSVISGGIGNMVSEMGNASAAWKTFQGNMSMNGKPQAEIADIQNSLQNFAADTVYSASDMASTFAQLAAVGTKNTEKLVKGFGGLAAAAENPQQAMKTLSQQATQMAAKPKVAWEDFKLMLEQTPAGMSQVAKAMGKTTQQLISDIQAGKVKTEDFLDTIAEVGTSDAFMKMATQYKTVGQAMDGLSETASNKLLPTFNVISEYGIKAVEKLSGAFDKIDGNALAGKVKTGLETVSKYWDAFITNMSGVGTAFSDAFSAVGAAFSELTGEIGFDTSIKSFGDAVQVAAGYLKTFAGFLEDNADKIALVLQHLPQLLLAYKGFKIVKAVVPFVSAFSGAIVKLAGKGIASLAGKLFGIAAGTKATGSASKSSSGSILKSAQAFMMMAGAVLLISSGFALLALSAVAVAESGGLAIGVLVGMAVAVAGVAVGMMFLLKSMKGSKSLVQTATAFLVLGAAILVVSAAFAVLAATSIALANAGPLAIGVMVGMVAAIALLAAGAAALGPALTAGAVGFLAFGAALVLVGVSAILASTAIVILSTALPALVEYGLQGAVAIAALGVSMGVFAAGAAVAGAGALLLGAGLLVVGAATLVAGAGVLVLAAGAIALGAGLAVTAASVTVLASALPLVCSGAMSSVVAFTALFAVTVALGASLLLITASFVAFGIGIVAATVGVAAFGVAMLAASAGTAVMAASLVAVNSSMKSIASNAKTAKKSITSMKDSVSIVNEGLDALGNKAKSAVDKLISTFSGAAGKAKNAGKKVGDGINDGVKNGTDKLPDTIKLAMNQFNAGLLAGGTLSIATSNQISNSVLSALKKTESGAYSCGYNIGAGLANGMAASLGRVQSIAAQLAAAAEKAIRAKAKIHSPSKVSDKLGQYWGEGYVEGMKKMFGEAKRTSMKLIHIPSSIKKPDLALAGNISTSDLSDDCVYEKNANYTIIVPVEIDGKEVAKTTAKYTEDELNKRERRNRRKQGKA
jgi:tape measure domain-containing protein|nr:MAG TPA: tail tape measure [Caudoviricetes sp.]